MVKYKKRWSKRQMRVLKKFWKKFILLNVEYHKSIQKLEKELSTMTRVDDVEFFQNDSGYVGIGDSKREHKLVQWEELE